ncbi:MAG: hypothetical protein ABSG78_15205 [Verrucomicrobiota bacterium]|jgi:hypothetical protein
MIDETTLAHASESWRKACQKLGVKVAAPYPVKVEDGNLTCIAYLPHFGKPKGMIIAAMDLPKIGPDRRLSRFAEEEGLFCSHVNATPFATTDVGETVFKEALEDWGYYGPASQCPSWFNGYKHFSDPQ